MRDCPLWSLQSLAKSRRYMSGSSPVGNGTAFLVSGARLDVIRYPSFSPIRYTHSTRRVRTRYEACAGAEDVVMHRSQCRTSAVGLRYAEHIRTPRQLADDPSRCLHHERTPRSWSWARNSARRSACSHLSADSPRGRLHASDTPISYMTLTNPTSSTEKRYATLRWGAANKGMPSRPHMDSRTARRLHG